MCQIGLTCISNIVVFQSSHNDQRNGSRVGKRSLCCFIISINYLVISANNNMKIDSSNIAFAKNIFWIQG